MSEVAELEGASAVDAQDVVAPPSPKRFFTVIGVILGTLVAIAIGLLWARAVFFSPDATVRGYITALQQRDVTSAVSRLDQPGRVGGEPLIQGEIVTNADYTPPDNLVVQSVDVIDDFATVHVTMRVADTTTPVAFHLRRESAAPWRLFRPWRIVDDLDYLRASWPYEGGITVAGKSFITHDFSSQAFPGTYVLTPGVSALVEAPPVTAAIASTDGTFSASTVFAATIKQTAQDDVQSQVTAYLDECAKQTTFQPPGCPFQVYGSAAYNSPANIVWTTTARPTNRLTIGNAGNLVLSSDTPSGTANVTWQITDSYTKRVSQVSDSTTFGVYGVVYENAGKVVFTPRTAG